MARLEGSNRTTIFGIRPLRISDDDECWVAAEYELCSLSGRVYEVAEVLTWHEMTEMSRGMLKVAAAQEPAFALEPMEPYFGFSVTTKRQGEEYSVRAFYSRNANALDTTSVSIDVSHETLLCFAHAVDRELAGLIGSERVERTDS